MGPISTSNLEFIQQAPEINADSRVFSSANTNKTQVNTALEAEPVKIASNFDEQQMNQDMLLEKLDSE